ncbi:Succinyl-CoA ligase [ADP-forming] alpha chain [Rubellimicrobium mesophilum DSM 19309]|uniref:Succinyl-CoA ligase [ADP-forming] alpha chain n=1 Tax=Rubellimicrobium mesophilum DSM 19309 TaxID=442562 RepID=A0A017HUF6_9RHOB|nr:Succinyl-CoA ligase [ADP-forming] alpha chain [Rubellimicrobium mesophilum DSM 19309]
MTVLLDRDTPVIVQGFTGRIGSFHAQEMIDYGTKVLGGVTPGKGGTTHMGLPVFNTVRGAVAETGATASIVFVPPPFAADSIMEAADAGIRFCVCITDGIPAQDMMRVKRYMRRYRYEDRMRLVGPNGAGVISPGQGMMGIMPAHLRRGPRGHRQPVGDPGLRGGEPDEGAGHRRVHLGGHRRRPDQRLLVPRHPGALREGPGHGCGRHDRRDRRPAGGRGGRLGARPHEQAAHRLHRGALGAQGQAHGPCRRHHLGLRGVGAGEGRDPSQRGAHDRPPSRRLRRDGGSGAEPPAGSLIGGEP